MNGITVREALKIGGLAKGHLVAGERGLERCIRYVDVIEVPDVARWIQRDEMLITTAYAIRASTEAQQNLVRELASRGASALVVKPSRYLGCMPRAMIQVANDMDFPLIEIPAEVGYVEVTHPLLQAILDRETQRLEWSEEVRTRLTQAVLKGGGLHAIAADLAALTGGTVMVCDDALKVMCTGNADGSQRVQVPGRTVLRSLVQGTLAATMNPFAVQPARVCGPDMQYLVSPIQAEGVLYGYVILRGSTMDTRKALTAIQHFVAVAALEFIKERAVEEATERTRRDLLDGLLHETLPPKEAAKQARRLGFRFGPRSVVLLGSVGNMSRALDVLDVIRDALLRSGSPGVVLKYGQHFLAFYTAKTDVPCELRREIEAVFSAVGARIRPSLRIGVSRFCADVAQLPRAYREARDALAINGRLWPCTVSTYLDTGLYSILSRIDNDELRDFCLEALRPLTLCERNSQRELLRETLRAYLENSCSVKKTAARLFIHRNTLRNRLDEIRRLFGSEFDTPPTSSTLLFCLQVLPILESDGQPNEGLST